MANTNSILQDSFGRKITYLRLSITDRCNLRCIYCMPQAQFSWMPPENILRYEEIIQIVRVLANLGIKKVRITGGEPLIRKDVIGLIERIAAINDIKKICITTNGILLTKMAADLFNAGLRHINISLDSLNPEKYKEITGFDQFYTVLKGIETCLDMGFNPVKINCVMIKGKNDDELVKFAELATKWPIEIRFIEFMPVGNDSKWGTSCFLSSDEAKKNISKFTGPLIRIKSSMDAGPAEIYSFSGAKGKIGFISPLSHKFCSTCNRIRIRADGTLRLCLFSDKELNLRNLVRSGVSDDELANFFIKALKTKPAKYIENQSKLPGCSRQMSSIGG